MAGETLTYVVAARRDAAGLPADWQEQVRQVAGLAVDGATPRRLQVRATAEAVATLRDRLGHVLLVEEASPRGFAG